MKRVGNLVTYNEFILGFEMGQNKILMCFRHGKWGSGPLELGFIWNRDLNMRNVVSYNYMLKMWIGLLIVLKKERTVAMNIQKH